MVRLFALAVLWIAACPAFAQQPAQPLAAPRPVVEEETPGFQPLRPAADSAVAPMVAPMPTPPEAAPPAAELPPFTPQPVAAPQPVAPPVAAPEPQAPAATIITIPDSLPTWTAGLLVLVGAILAGLVGAVVSKALRRSELATRRQAVAATLAAELETRKLALESVPLPPNIDAGVSFVSSVISLAGIDAGFRSAQSNLFLLPAATAANLSVHYAAVQRLADFVKGQSLAAAVRMLQANRLGGHPCPDAGAMRDAHVEMIAAFRGVDKLISGLKALAR